MNSKFKVIGQAWEESEAGWGSRRDGWSFHSSKENHEAYLKDYWDKMPKNVPGEYSREYGKPVEVEVSEELYNEVQKEGSVRLWANNIDSYKTWKK